MSLTETRSCLRFLQSHNINIENTSGSHNLDFTDNFEGVMMFDSQNIHNEFSNQFQYSIHDDFENMKWIIVNESLSLLQFEQLNAHTRKTACNNTPFLTVQHNLFKKSNSYEWVIYELVPTR